MKEHGDNLSSDKLLRDQELHHLVTSSIPSPTYHTHPGLSLMSAQAGLVLDPLYSTHLFASLVAANAANAASPLTPGTARFQLPIPIPLALQPASHQTLLQPHLHHQRNLFHHLPGTTPAAAAFAGVPGGTAQLDILSSWVANADDKKITSTTSSTPPTSMANNVSSSNNNNNKNRSNSGTNKSGRKPGSRNNVVSAKNQKNTQQQLNANIGKQKRSGGKRNGKNERGTTGKLVHEGVVSSSENDLPKLKDAKLVVVETKEPMMPIHESIIQPFLFSTSKASTPPSTPKSGRKPGENGLSSPHNNNNNNVTSLKGQGSPGSGGGGQNGGPRDKVFTCPTCNRCFGYKHVLQNHERTHTGEKPFECNICMKKFTRDHHLKTHMRLHTGEKPYQCTHCDRQFVQVANLRRHLRVHTGERPYACELCSSRFSDSNQLKAHMLIHKDTSEEMSGPQLNSSLDDEETSNSPPQLVTPSSTGEKRDGHGAAEVVGGKRGRKCRETRRIIRLEGIPVKCKSTASATTFHLPAVVAPEQDHPEDLSMTGGLRVRHYSGSSSSVTASSTPSPRAPSLMLLSTRPYSSSSSFEEHPDLYGSEEEDMMRAAQADSSTNGKLGTENESSSMSD